MLTSSLTLQPPLSTDRGLTMTTVYLQVAESISRKRDTAGQQVLTLTDIQTGKAFAVTGGGFDRLGTAFGMWIQATQQQPLTQRLSHLAEWWVIDGKRMEGEQRFPGGRELLGFTYTASGDLDARKYFAHIDGGVGFMSMLEIASACRLEVSTVSNTQRDVVLIIVNEANQ